MKTDTLFAFIGGAVLGAAVAMLFAPDKGEETRKKIRDTFEKEYQNLKEKMNPEEAKVETEKE